MEYKIQDLIDIEHFQHLQDRLNTIYSFPSAIIDNDGNILTATAWQDICTQFHRKNKETEKLCVKSDTYIQDHIHEANPTVSYRCPHGFVDNATPIIIDGIHYGNFFTGQFFLEKPDLEYFRVQAKKYGFDEESYLEAVKNVPVWSKDQLDNYLFFIKGLIAVISESGLKTLREIENRKQIQESAKKHKSILKTAMDGYWLTDANGRLLEVNDSYCRMSGYSEDELLMKYIFDLEASENAEHVAQHMQKVVSHGSDRFESKHRRKDGTVFSVEVSVQFRNEDGGQCVCFLRDITERKQAQKSLQASEKRYRTLFENMAQGVFYQTKDGVLTDYNNAALEMFGLTPDQFIGKTSLDPQWKVIREDGRDLPGDKHPSMVALQTGKPVRDAVVGVYNTRTKDIKWLLVNATPQRNKEGEKPYQVFVTLQDITDRKLTEERLRESETDLRRAQAIAHVGSYSWNHRTNHVTWSDELRRLLWCDDLEPSYDLFLSRIHPEDKDRVLVQALKRRSTGIPQEIEYRIVGPDGTIRWMRDQTQTEIDGQGQPVRSYGTNQDITQRKKAEKENRRLETQLQHAQKMKSIGTLAGGIAHEFNNMLAIILGNNELIMEDLPPSSFARESAEEIRIAGLRARDVVKQLLTFSRQDDTADKVMDLTKVLQESMKLIRSTTPTNIKIEQNLSANSYPVMGNETQINQLLINLCNNAIDALPEKEGILTVELLNETIDNQETKHLTELQSGQYVTLMVSDNGIGMDEDVLERVFEPYFTTKDIGEGSGIGMAVVHGIVERHGGAITVDSKPDRGTTFRIFLPVHEGLIEQNIDQHNILPVGDERLLFVDDEPSIAKLGKRLLESLGYTTESMCDPEEALDIIKSDPYKFNLLITDMAMPGMTGDQLVAETLKIRQDMPTIICTGYSSKISEKEATDIGVQSFVMKPINKSELATMVRKALDSAKSSDPS